MSLGKRILLMTGIVTAAIGMSCIGASACTMIYAGSDLTDDGATYFARSEDYVNSQNKLFYVSEAGKYEAGEYRGCSAYGGFTWTFDHDSYAYTAFDEDSTSGICPECGEAATHPAYQEAGTNEKGVTVSATETLSGNGLVNADGVDPFITAGIEEVDIPTVLLSQAATAREALNLLLEIYDTAGCHGASGILIADQKETWYVENCSGTQYIALKLTPDMLILEPNMAVIGEIDLDDTENVIASDRLIEVAKQAGTFKGEEEENIIDFRASYSRLNIDSRLVNGLNFINGSYHYTAEDLEENNALFTISNLRDDSVVPLYTNIEADRTITPADVINYYKIDGIGRDRNADTAFFQIWSEGAPETSTVEWVAMDHLSYNVFVPYYPMLLTDTYAGYKVGTDKAKFVTEEPESGTYYPSSSRVYHEDGTSETVKGYTVLPEGWKDSLYWSFDALSNYIITHDLTDAQRKIVLGSCEKLQDAVCDTAADMRGYMPALASRNRSAAQRTATDSGADMAETSHAMALSLYQYLTADDADTLAELRYYLDGGKTVLAALADEGDDVLQLQLPDGYEIIGANSGGEVIVKDEETGGIFSVSAVFVSDVSSSDSWADEVRFGVSEGLFEGTGSDGFVFGTEGNVTRAAFTTLLYRLAGASAADTALPFTDVPTGSWYADAVAWACENGVVKGVTDSTFCPGDNITRQQMAAMLYRYNKLLGDGENGAGDLSSFADASDVASYAEDAVAWAVENGYLNGTADADGSRLLNPDGNATRAQAAAILMRYLQR